MNRTNAAAAGFVVMLALVAFLSWQLLLLRQDIAGVREDLSVISSQLDHVDGDVQTGPSILDDIQVTLHEINCSVQTPSIGSRC